MAQTLPTSLSPHIAIISSPDLGEVLKNASLPSLPHILQSFSPLPQVTTRTTTLVSVPHTSFALRFSDLLDIEEACREHDDQRAERTLDWITARISHRCAKWVQDIEKVGDKDAVRTPWWDELRRCIEGDLVPSKFEGWNHPVALILAASTAAPNPLQAITTLHSRNIQLPAWVDSNLLRYTLIIHPQDSSLSDEEATALYNAVKKQFGLHSYLLPLALPRPPPPPVPVPALLPHLPPPPTPDSTASKMPPLPAVSTVLNTICMAETDIQHTARFTREFVVMSLVPWMEKCVLEWNENFSSTRRLPSRLFSSTRRLFGTPSPSPSPTPVASSGPTRSMATPAANGGPIPPSQTRRLAEFATVLGDIKLATTVWEALRKESRGGSDILPLLLSPTVSTKHYAQAALMSINASMMDLTPHEQIRVLLYAARWEASIATQELLNDEIEGERWLVWAASNAEEAPAALLLAQAALLSTKKHTWRKAALWYFIAANRLEKCGIKPLTMYFMAKARELYSVRPQKELSPSFWNSEGKSPANSEGLENIMSGIEHPLGRLLYTTGDVAAAVKIFLGLLRGSSAFLSSEEARTVSTNDKVYIDDFRVALSYLNSTGAKVPGDFELPFKICVSKLSRPRYPSDTNDNTEVWSSLQNDWNTFWRTKGGKEILSPAGYYSTNELFWVDLKLSNPLAVDVTLTNITLIAQDTDLNSTVDFVEVETIKEVLLHAKESTIIPISLKSTRPAKLGITHAVYDFLSLMPTKESLARRGRRLHDTLLQRQSRAYAPDTFMSIDILPSDHRLTVKFGNNEYLRLNQGENRSLQISLLNSGSNPISEIWMIAGAEDDIWVGPGNGFLDSETKTISSSNSLKTRPPQRLQAEDPDKPLMLQPGESMEFAIILHAESLGTHELCLMFVFRKDVRQPFFSARLSKPYHVESLFDISAIAHPSSSQDHAYTIELEVMNISSISNVCITDIVCASPQWKCQPVLKSVPDYTISSQCFRLLLGASPWLEGKGSAETFDFVLQSVNRLLKGAEQDQSLSPPPIDLLCSHIFQKFGKPSTQNAPILNFIHSARRRYIAGQLSRNFPSIPPVLQPTIFPLYNPAATDFVVFWEIPSQNRSGHANLHGVTLGARHGLLEGLIEDVERAKGSRSMYAETRRENMQVMENIRHSEWNHEMDPLVLSVKNSRSRAHDFSTGPCHISIEFLLQNHSLTLSARYTLKLQSGAGANGSPPTMYAGRPIFRGELGPRQVASVEPHLWVTRPGTYSLGGWSLETEISMQLSSQRTRKRNYLQKPSPSDNECIVVYDSRTL